MRSLLLAILLSACSAACMFPFPQATARYAPRSEGRVSISVRGGHRVLVKDGKLRPLTARNLLRLVAAEPWAYEAACRYRRRDLLSRWIALPTGICTGFAGATYLDQVHTREGGPSEATMTAFYGCAAVLALAVWIGEKNDENLYDAINLYNDHLAADRPSGTTPSRPWPWPARPSVGDTDRRDDEPRECAEQMGALSAPMPDREWRERWDQLTPACQARLRDSCAGAIDEWRQASPGERARLEADIRPACLRLAAQP